MTAAKTRQGAYGDLAQISHVLALAFRDDDTFGGIMHPNRHIYPDDVELYFLQRGRVAFWDYRWRWIVALDTDAAGKEVIVGCAQWHRKGPGGKNMDLWWFDPRQFGTFSPFASSPQQTSQVSQPPELKCDAFSAKFFPVQHLILPSRKPSQTFVGRRHEGACNDLAQSSRRPRDG